MTNLSALTVPPSIRSPLIVTPTRLPVIVPLLITTFSIKPDSAYKYRMAASPILEKSIFAYLPSISEADNLVVSSSSMLASLAAILSVVTTLKSPNVDSRFVILALAASRLVIVAYLISASLALSLSVSRDLISASVASNRPAVAVLNSA